MHRRMEPLALFLKVAAFVLLAALFFVALKRVTAPPRPGEKRDAVLRKIEETARDRRLMSPYSEDQIEQRIKAYTGQ